MVLRDDLRIVLGPEHFLGTIHGFLITFVLAPFGHLFRGEAHPVVRTDDDWPSISVHGDPKQRVKLSDFRRAPDGSLVLHTVPRGVKGTPEEVIASVGADVIRYKNSLFKKHGFLSADDAMWAALQILRNRPDIARAVAARFDEILLDEAQDTSELQLECVKLLRNSGALRSLALVGDLEQSICSFQGASAAGCRDLAVTCGLRELELTENHRSSQRICDIAAKFRTRKDADRAVGPDRHCAIQPELAIYSAKDPASAVDIFRTRLDAHAIPTTDATVLARGHAIVETINGEAVPKEVKDNHVLIGSLAAAAAAGTLTRHHVAAAQRLVAASAWTLQPHELDDEQRSQARAAGHALLVHLPPVKGSVQQFIEAARGALTTAVSTVVERPKRSAAQLLPLSRGLDAYEAAAVFSPMPRDLAARTVHSFKGEDSDAVLVVVRRYLRSDPTEQMQLFRSVTTGDVLVPEKEEERRVMFVALTRARRYCLVALPDDRHGLEIAGRCADLGFSVLTA
jgi:superfamily I DNA/RNA helicase